MTRRVRLIVEKNEHLAIRVGDDVVRTRQAVRALALQAGFSLVDQTKIITAASEIARNTLDYGGGGELTLELLRDGARRGLRLTFTDRGPGISDIEQALKDGYSSGNGLGLGLSGAKRLSNEFAIDSRPGAGTKITLARWK
ncbi:MAG: anti-sigma regulatory factor [Dongiales bacterium]